MQRSRELFINGVRQVQVHGNATVPTIVRYEGGKALVGVEALQGCENPSHLREDFKGEIGNEDPLKLAQRTGTGTATPGRSILGSAKNSPYQILGRVLTKVAILGASQPARQH